MSTLVIYSSDPQVVDIPQAPLFRRISGRRFTLEKSLPMAFCGTTTPTPTPELMVEAFHAYHVDILTLFVHDSLAIVDFEQSLNYDIKLLRSSTAVPKRIKLYGFFCEISSAN